MTPGSDQVNRIRKVKRMQKPILLRNVIVNHIHPRRVEECSFLFDYEEGD